MLKTCQTFTCFTDEKQEADDDSPPLHPHSLSSPPSRVSIRHVSVCTGTTRTCVSRCARGAGTHGDVSDGHIVHTTHHTAPQNTTQHNMTHHTTPHHTHNTHTTQNTQHTQLFYFLRFLSLQKQISILFFTIFPELILHKYSVEGYSHTDIE